jgi:phage gpG-like protein
MATVRVVLNENASRSVALAAANEDLKLRANRVLNAARRLAPVDRGQLRASLTVEYANGPGGPIARIGSNLPYAIFVHEGTGLFGPRGMPITPKRGRFLVFTPRGASKPVFARSVRGMPGRPFLLQALKEAE